MATPSPSHPLPRSSTYIPGVCNIGPAERAKRRQSGIVGAIVAIVLIVLFALFQTPWPFRLLILIPASIGATGFLQDVMHFCAGFGMKGLYNVVNSAGITKDVELEDFRRQDKRRALQIILLSILIGAIVTVIGIIV